MNIQLIGVKRAMLLGILLAVNLSIAAVYFLWLTPLRSGAETQVATLGGQISRLQGNIQNVKKELAEFKVNLPKYEALKNSGFFSTQDRFQLERDLTRIKDASGTGGFGYSVGAVRDINSVEANNAKLRLLASRIDIGNTEVRTDVDFFSLLDVMQQQFPAHVRLQSFVLKRGVPLTDEALERLRQGDALKLVNATAVFDWMTVAPPLTPEEQAAQAAAKGKGR